MTVRSEPEFDVVIARDIMVPMRDGVRLATDVYRPARDGKAVVGKYPVILTRTPYNKSATAAIEESEFWARRGYVRVIQDVRGRYGSEGSFYLIRDEGPDGFDTVEWAGTRPWSDGQVGMIGTSYLAWVQNAAAVHNPPHLKAIWPNQGGANGLTSSLRQGGALELRWLGWSFWGGASSKEARANPAVAAAMEEAAIHLRDWLLRLPWREGQTPLANIPDYERWALDYYRTATFGEGLWDSTALNFEWHADRHADIPATYSGGWYDSYTRATCENYMTFSRLKQSPQRLIIGPWTHGSDTLGLRHSGHVDLGDAAPVNGNLAEDFDHLMLRFFDFHLKGLANGLAAEPPVKIFVMGGGSGRRLPDGRLDHGGRWRDEPAWPLARAIETSFYFNEGGALTTTKPLAATASSSFDFDPANPIPTISANISSLEELVPALEGTWIPTEMRSRSVVTPGGRHQAERPDVFMAKPPYLPLSSRPDVLVFQTEPLATAVEVTGAVRVHLWVSTSAADTDFTAKLLDIYPASEDWPEGYHLNLTDSIMRLRFREGADRERFVPPGDVVEVEIDLYPTSNVFAPGHCIRVDISSSNFPRFDINPNTGEPIGRHTHTEVARNAVYRDAARSSCLVLPVVPAG